MAYRQIAPIIKDDLPRATFIIDTDTDLTSLPVSGVGSIAISVDSGNIYMVNASEEWKLFGGV